MVDPRERDTGQRRLRVVPYGKPAGLKSHTMRNLSEVDLGKPVVVLLSSGRPLIASWLFEDNQVEAIRNAGAAVWIAACWAAPVAAQTMGTVTGRVSDASSGMPERTCMPQ